MNEPNVFKVPGGTVIGLFNETPELILPTEPEEEKTAPKKRTKKSAEADKQ